MKKLALVIVGLLALVPQVVFGANPYSVAGGNGAPGRLGMPADSEVYDWNNLRSENQFNMVRPCSYWDSVSVPHRDHGYHQSSNTIHNESNFRTWVRNNPGKTWIIGNEMDIPSQDGVSESEYARMFNLYTQVIRSEDASATFAVGGPGGLKGNEDWNSQRSFFEGFIDSYKSQFGTAPPVDVWNTHVYGRSAGDVAWSVSLIDDFVSWVGTTEGGMYSDSEIIISEFGLFGNHSDSTMINFMNDITEEFEIRVTQGELDRFFWFIGAWCDCGAWTSSSLFGPDQQPNALGLAYAQRAVDWSGGLDVPDISVTPTSHAFGDVAIGSSEQHTFEVSNGGTADLHVQSTNLTGADAGQFNIDSGAAPFTLAPGGSQQVVVSFGPLWSGAKSATLSIESDDPDEPQVNVVLNGAGTDTAPEVTHEETESGGSTAAGTVTTATSLAGVRDHLYLATVASNPVKPVVGMSGLGLSWTRVDAQCGTRKPTGVEVWMAQGTPTGDGAVTASFSSAPSNAVIAVSRYSSVDTVAPIGDEVSGNINGVDGACHGGHRRRGPTGGSAYAFELTTNAPGSRVYVATAMRRGPHTPGAGYAERVELSHGNLRSVATLAVQDQLVASAPTVPVDGSFGPNRDWAVVGLEIRAGSGSASSAEVAHEETRNGGSTSASMVTTTESLAGVAGHLYLAAITSKPFRTVSSVSGLGLSWSRVGARCGARNATGVEVWMALGSPSGAGVVTASLASAPENAALTVSRFSGANATAPIGNVVSGNTNGVGGACSGGTDNPAYSLDLTTSAPGSVAYGAIAMRNKSHTPGAGYVERSEFVQGSGGGAASVAVQDKTVAVTSGVTVDGSFNSNVDWAVVGLEIVPE